MWAAIVAFLLVQGAYSHPTGATEESCDDPVPKHKGVTPIPAGDDTPFVLEQSKTDFVTGDVINVTLSAKSTPFKGFFVRAFLEDESLPAGEFLAQPGAQPLNKCSAITHIDNTPKQQVVLRWTAPKEPSSGKVYFRATVVEEYTKVYVGLQSQ